MPARAYDPSVLCALSLVPQALLTMHSRPASAHLLHKWLVQVIWAANAEIDHIHLGCHCVVEGVQEPGGVRYLQAAQQDHGTCPD